MMLKTFIAAAAFALCSCATAPAPDAAPLTPNEQAIAAGVTAYDALSTSMIAADAAIRANLLKGKNADVVVGAAITAKGALDAMLVALRAANAAAPAPATGVPAK